MNEGSFDNLTDVQNALQGVYGAWVNTDSFTVGEQKEIFLGMRIFELAKQVKTVRHWIWSGLDYVDKVCRHFCSLQFHFLTNPSAAAFRIQPQVQRRALQCKRACFRLAQSPAVYRQR